MSVRLLIFTDNKCIEPITVGEITLHHVKIGSPSSLTFTIYEDKALKELDVKEGNKCLLLHTDFGKTNCIFNGYIFKRSRDRTKEIKFTAYDSLRYLINEDSMVFTNVNATEILKMICDRIKNERVKFNPSKPEETPFKIPELIEDGKTYLDMMKEVLDLSFYQTAKQKTDNESILATQKNPNAPKIDYVLFVDPIDGELKIKKSSEMQTGVVITTQMAENYSYETSIDESYNIVRLYQGKKDTAAVNETIEKDDKNVTDWGPLIYSERIQDDTNGQDFKTLAKARLKELNKVNAHLKYSNVIGNINFRGGSRFVIETIDQSANIRYMMVVKEVTHKFSGSSHLMDVSVESPREGVFYVSGNSNGNTPLQNVTENKSKSNNYKESYSDQSKVLY